jgi:hypothetical protein
MIFAQPEMRQAFPVDSGDLEAVRVTRAHDRALHQFSFTIFLSDYIILRLCQSDENRERERLVCLDVFISQVLIALSEWRLQLRESRIHGPFQIYEYRVACDSGPREDE